MRGDAWILTPLICTPLNARSPTWVQVFPNVISPPFNRIQNKGIPEKFPNEKFGKKIETGLFNAKVTALFPILLQP